MPRHRHVGDRAEVVDLVGLCSFDRRDEAALVEEVPLGDLDVPDMLAQPGDMRIGLSPDEAPDLISPREQMLGEI
jgi:hypothetical protein